MKKLLLAGMILLLLTACTGPSPLEGTWELKTDYSELVEMSEAELGNLDGYVELESLALRSVYTFRSDGTYTCKIDVEQFIRDCEAAWVEGINAYYEDQIRENNLDITVQEAWALDGITKDDLVDESIIRSALADAGSEGNYKTEEDRLYLSDGTENRVDEAVYTVFRLDGDTLTFTSAVGGTDSAEFPLTLTRIA